MRISSLPARKMIARTTEMVIVRKATSPQGGACGMVVNDELLVILTDDSRTVRWLAQSLLHTADLMDARDGAKP